MTIKRWTKGPVTVEARWDEEHWYAEAIVWTERDCVVAVIGYGTGTRHENPEQAALITVQSFLASLDAPVEEEVTT